MPQNTPARKGKPEIDSNPELLNWDAAALTTIPNVILDNALQFIDPTQMLIVIHMSRRVMSLSQIAQKMNMEVDEVRACLGVMIAKGMLKIEKNTDDSPMFDFFPLTQACIEAEKQNNDQ